MTLEYYAKSFCPPSLGLHLRGQSLNVTTSMDDQYITKSFFFATKFVYRGLLFSKLSLISIGEGGGSPTKFPGIQESSGGTIWNEQAFHTFHTATAQANSEI